MEMIFILLPLAVLTAGLFLVLFMWAVRSGQYDDLETPPVRMLNDDAKVASATVARSERNVVIAGEPPAVSQRNC